MAKKNTGLLIGLAAAVAVAAVVMSDKKASAEPGMGDKPQPPPLWPANIPWPPDPNKPPPGWPAGMDWPPAVPSGGMPGTSTWWDPTSGTLTVPGGNGSGVVFPGWPGGLQPAGPQGPQGPVPPAPGTSDWLNQQLQAVQGFVKQNSGGENSVFSGLDENMPPRVRALVQRGLSRPLSPLERRDAADLLARHGYPKAAQLFR